MKFKEIKVLNEKEKFIKMKELISDQIEENAYKFIKEGKTI